MRFNLDLDNLRAFCEVAQRLNYKNAADALNISASALSRRIQKLEESLNVQLLVRTTREARLTPAGKQLLQGSRSILNDAEELLFALKGEGTRNARNVRIGCVPSAMKVVLMPALSELTRTYTNAQVKILDSTAVHVLDSIFQQDIDLGISYMGENESGLDFDPLLVDPFIVAVRTDHPFAQRQSVSWEEVAEQRTVAARHGAGLRMLMDLGLAKIRQRITWSYEVQHVNSALALVNEGMGVAIVPRICVTAANYANIVGIPLLDVAIARTLGLVQPSNTEMRMLTGELYTILKRQARALEGSVVSDPQ